MKLCEIAEEFKQLDLRRRQGGLSLGEAEQYRSLFARLSEALTATERRRKADARQFLRVEVPMQVVLRTPDGTHPAALLDYGGGGCSISDPGRVHQPHSDLWIDGVVCDGVAMPLHGRAEVVWAKDGVVGLRFAIDCADMRDQVDRILYRVLDLFLAPPKPAAQPQVQARAATAAG